MKQSSIRRAETDADSRRDLSLSTGRHASSEVRRGGSSFSQEIPARTSVPPKGRELSSRAPRIAKGVVASSAPRLFPARAPCWPTGSHRDRDGGACEQRAEARESGDGPIAPYINRILGPLHLVHVTRNIGSSGPVDSLLTDEKRLARRALAAYGDPSAKRCRYLTGNARGMRRTFRA